MLKGIPPCISPELLKVLHEMGHGDTLVIGDANFPAASCAKNNILVRADGHRATEMLDAILQIFPLDNFVAKPVTIMDKMEMHSNLETPVWDEFAGIVAKYDERGRDAIDYMGRYAFYEVAKRAYAVLATSETAFYACIIIQKGCL
jgi:L-fucose mutarotase